MDKTPIIKTFSTSTKVSAGERAVTAIISSSAVDRVGDVLQPMGLNSKNYEKNPIVCYAHDAYFSLPIGKTVALKRDDETVTAKVVFAERPDTLPADEEWQPDTIFSLFQQGVLNAFSVGFLPIEVRAATPRDQTKYGDGVRQIYSKWELYELSVVPLPANQDAIATAVSKGLITQEAADKMFKTSGPGQEIDHEHIVSWLENEREPAKEDAKLPEIGEKKHQIEHILEPETQVKTLVFHEVEDETPEPPIKKLVVCELNRLRGRVYNS